MAKKLISVRIDEELLKEIDEFRKPMNENYIYKATARNYYCRFYGYISKADVIEHALREYLKNHKI